MQGVRGAEERLSCKGDLLKMEKARQRLIKALEDIWDDNEFILGVLNDVYDDKESIEAVLSYIQTGEDVTPGTIVLLSLELSQNGGRRIK